MSDLAEEIEEIRKAANDIANQCGNAWIASVALLASRLANVCDKLRVGHEEQPSR